MAKITQGRAADTCRYLDEDTTYRMGMRRILQGMVLMKEAKTIVVIGTGKGKTLACVSLAASKIRGKVYAIDAEHRGQKPTMRMVTRDENVEWIWESPDDVGKSLIPEPVDMLVIDDMLFSGDFKRIERISKLVKKWTKRMAPDGIIVIRSKILSPFEVDKLPTAKVESRRDDLKVPEWPSLPPGAVLHDKPEPEAVEPEASASDLPKKPEDALDGEMPEDVTAKDVFDGVADFIDGAAESTGGKDEEISLSSEELDEISIDKECSPESDTEATNNGSWRNRGKIRSATRRKLGKKPGKKSKKK